MPRPESFACLWCGRPYTIRSPDDIEGFAQLCPDCIGRAGENGFLRFRLKTALAERAAASRRAAGVAPTAGTPDQTTASSARASTSGPETGSADLHDEMIAYYSARAPEYDDFYLRRGRYAHGPIDAMAWQADLDFAGQWLDALPVRGEIVELAAGTGWWSPLLASKGELWLYDVAEAPLSIARDRLLAHNLRAHLHVRDAWAEPDRRVDAVFAGFWLSHVPRARLAEFLSIAGRWLKPGGTFAFIDSRLDPASSASDQPAPPDDPSGGPEVARRRLADGREFRVTKVFYEPVELEAALRSAGFRDPVVTTTSRFFLLGAATAAT
ncbi:MAG TPA: class I SAM-dependent methyltransferase [Candidatus Saccharimonadales bacterium]|nr:class I SAM-dependent methyltransferase [Candidatus Saccharimonadales bacterium]